MMMSILFLALLGFFISFYAFKIEKKIIKDSTYKPLCDISEKVSCSKPILSPYGKFFGVSNAGLGMFFYAIVMGLAFMQAVYTLFFLSLAALLVSFYFAWVLYVRIRVFCLLCSLIYAINILLFLVSYSYL